MTASAPLSSGSTQAGSRDVVLVIHGTFNAPEAGGSPKWFEPDPNDEKGFCSRLNSALAATPLGEAVWRDIDREQIFSWSGDNDHDARCTAGRRLCDYILDLADRNPDARIHLVAHSHGGNVVLRAIELYYEELAKRAPAFRRVPSRFSGVERMRALLTLDSRRLAEERKACTADADEPGTIGRPSNRLGRIVFMGTPFYHKRWVVSRHRGARFLAYLAGCLLAAPALFGLTWLVMPLFGLIFHSLTFTAWNVVTRFGMGPYWVRSIGWNVFTWPKWLIGLWLGMCVLFVLIGYRESRRFNTNMYFSSNSAFRKEPAEPSGWRPERLPCLVISANLLDEALLALSAEALVYALLVPRVWDLLGLAPRSWGDMLSAASGHRPPAGAEEPQSVAGYRELTLLGIGGVLLLLYLVLVHWWWRYVVRLLLAPRAVALLMGVITTAAFGVPASELRRSRIEVSSSLDMPEVFDVEEWLVGDEVLKQSTSASLPPVSAKETWKGYQHLVDAAELERKITESAKAHSVFSWQRVEAFIPEIYERYRQSFALEASGGGLDLPEFSRHLARVWFTLLERGKEMTGAVELNHSVYYANPQVIRRVAAFLAGGE